jgi:hypothetical protein
VSLRVTDPSGVEWDVSREWLSRPLWNGDWAGYPVDIDLPDVDLAGDDVGGVIAIAIAVVVVIALFVVLFFFWPLVSLLFALAVGGALLLARMAGVAPWTVRAVSADRSREWRVRGFLRSRRVMHGVARALERGGEAALEAEMPA